MEQLVTIELFGQPYTFKTESEVTNANNIVDFLKTEVVRVENQMRNNSQNITKRAILIMTALNILNEKFEMKKEHSILLQDISERSTELNNKLDYFLK